MSYPPEEYIEPAQYDMVHKVPHYQLFDGIEVRHVIAKVVDVNNLKGHEAAFVANALKYLMRCGRKGNFKQDIEKAKKYLEFILEDS